MKLHLFSLMGVVARRLRFGGSRLLVIPLAACFAIQAHGADEYPSRPVRLIVGLPPGGSTDSVARVVATALHERFSHPVVVENRPGASTQIATEAVMNAAPDGYTLQLADSTLTILPSVRKRPPWNPLKDFTPIAQVAMTGLVFAAKEKLPVKTLKEFVALAKTRPGSLTYGSAGDGSILHLVAEMLRSEAGVELTHVPYRGAAPIIADLMGGQIDIGVLGPIDVATRSDRLRALAQTGPTRHPLLSQVPTSAEAGFPGVAAVSMFTLVGPPGLPKSIVDRIVRELQTAMDKPEFKDKIIAAGSMPILRTGPSLSNYLADDMRRWQAIAKAANVSLDN